MDEEEIKEIQKELVKAILDQLDNYVSDTYPDLEVSELDIVGTDDIPGEDDQLGIRFRFVAEDSVILDLSDSEDDER